LFVCSLILPELLSHFFLNISVMNRGLSYQYRLKSFPLVSPASLRFAPLHEPSRTLPVAVCFSLLIQPPETVWSLFWSSPLIPLGTHVILPRLFVTDFSRTPLVRLLHLLWLYSSPSRRPFSFSFLPLLVPAETSHWSKELSADVTSSLLIFFFSGCLPRDVSFSVLLPYQDMVKFKTLYA